MYSISIQNKVLLFRNGVLIGETTIKKIEDFCMQHNLQLPEV